jgi:hypothetical protein
MDDSLEHACTLDGSVQMVCMQQTVNDPTAHGPDTLHWSNQGSGRRDSYRILQ